VNRDGQLVTEMMRGEASAFAALYENYGARLRQYALSLLRDPTEAEDVTHDVFIGLAKQVSAGHAPREVAAYLYASTRNRSLDRLRRKPARALTELDLELLAAPPGDETRAELRHALERALLALPPEQAEVVVLRTWHDLDHAAIAALQGTSVNTVLSRYQYGLSKLRKELDAHGG
jgi:RNA polymerase sigma-70 factor (ECF subfamily)